MINPNEIKPSSSLPNFIKAFSNLERSLSSPILEPRDLSGIIKDFEMTYELSWKVLKKKLQAEGHQTLGAKDVYSKAFQLGFIENEGAWLKMIECRNQTAHVYDEAAANAIVVEIQSKFIKCFQALKKLMVL